MCTVLHDRSFIRVIGRNGDGLKSLLRQSESLRALRSALRSIPGDVRKAAGMAARGARIRDYLAAHTVRKLQIGAGPNEFDGWLNADYSPRSRSAIFMDATQPFPLPSGSFDFIFSEHMIEHVPFEQGQKMIAESFRVLKPGGTIRIATPNLEKVAALETAGPTEAQLRYVRWAIEHHVEYAPRDDSGAESGYRPSYVINNFFWGFGHYFVYDPASLGGALRRAGFVNVRSFMPGESDVPELRGLETHARLIGEEFNLFETMVLQATKR